MQRKRKRRQHQPKPYKQILSEVLIILVIWNVAQGDPHNVLLTLIHSLAKLS